MNECPTEAGKADGGGEEKPYLVETALDTVVLGVSDQSATLVFSSLFYSWKKKCAEITQLAH